MHRTRTSHYDTRSRSSTYPITFLSAGGIDISVRQFLFVVVAVLIDINLWLFIMPSTAATLSNIVGWTVLAIPVILALVFGWITVQGQPLEIRLLRMMRYYGRPKIFIWQRYAAPEIPADTQDTPETQQAAHEAAGAAGKEQV